MFSNISWQQYWTSLIVVTLAYYLVIYLVYFRKGLVISTEMKRFHISASGQKEIQPALFAVDNPGIRQSVKEGEDLIIEACMDELNAFFENRKRTKAVKSELIFGLYTILQKYPSIKNSGYKESLTNVIASQCENICSTHLSAEELTGVWFG